MAAQALLELAADQRAFLNLEAEAKIADHLWPGLKTKIDPHHITAALRALLGAGELDETTKRTRGGRSIKVFHEPIEPGKARMIEDASARKRLLHARYLSWASGSSTGGAGAIGPGLEAVVHTSLQAAAPHGYRLLNPAAGEVRQLFGADVPGGSMGNGAWLTSVDPHTYVPRPPILMLLEAKNLRQYIYPRTQELHQLLAKAAVVKVAHPVVPVLPVLVCRKMHYLTTAMALQLGFYVIQTHRQYVRPFLAEGEATKAHLDEVNDELGYDVVPEAGPVDAMTRHFREPIQVVAERTAERRALSAPLMAETFAQLRDDGLSYTARADAMSVLAQLAEEAHGEETRWATI